MKQQFSPALLTPFAAVVPPQASPDDHFIPISQEEYANLCEPWKLNVIVKIVGTSFSKEFLAKELKKQWKLGVQPPLTALGKGFYRVKCSSIQERAMTLSQGPWSILNHHLWVQSWEPGFKPSAARCNMGTVWIKHPELPMEFYRQDFLAKIGKKLGQLVKIDKNSLQGDGKRYANLCVLMTDDMVVPKGIWLGNFFQEIEVFPGPWYCVNCEKLGHGGKSCPLRKVEKRAEEQEEGEWVKKSNPKGTQLIVTKKKWVPRDHPKISINGSVSTIKSKKELGNNDPIPIFENPFHLLDTDQITPPLGSELQELKSQSLEMSCQPSAKNTQPIPG